MAEHHFTRSVLTIKQTQASSFLHPNYRGCAVHTPGVLFISTASLSPKACEGGRVGVAEILAREFPEVTGVRDNRGNLPRDLVPNWTQQWQVVLGAQDLTN